MKRYAWLLALAAGLAPAAELSAQPFRICTERELRKVRESLRGQLVDFTYNHGDDNRIFSPALDEKRDLYLYLPPGYDPCLRYPVMMYLHGIGQDEKNFLGVVDKFDAAIATGKLPPFVIVVPDGSIQGRPTFINGGSFYLNTRAGRFQDWIQIDAWNFVNEKFSVRPDRAAHVIGGASMGGFGAYNHAIKFRERYATVFAFAPALNTRYTDCHGRYNSDFDPTCTAYRQEIRRFSPIGRFYGVIIIREGRLLRPLYGRNPDTLAKVAADNPTEMLTTYDVKPGELAMYAAYGDRDEFNIDAQVESFAHEATVNRGLTITTQKVLNGRHNTDTGRLVFPDMMDWIHTHVERAGGASPVPK